MEKKFGQSKVEVDLIRKLQAKQKREMRELIRLANTLSVSTRFPCERCIHDVFSKTLALPTVIVIY